MKIKLSKLTFALLALFAALILFINVDKAADKKSSTPEQTQVTTKQQETKQDTTSNNKNSREKLALSLTAKATRGANNTLYLQRPQKTELSGNLFYEGNIFQRQGKKIPVNKTRNKFAKSSIAVKFSKEELNSFLTSNATSFSLPLNENEDVTVKVKRVLDRGEYSKSLVANIEDHKDSEAFLVFHDGAVSGSIGFYNTNRYYDIGMSNDGSLIISEIDEGEYPERCDVGKTIGSTSDSLNPHQLPFEDTGSSSSFGAENTPETGDAPPEGELTISSEETAVEYVIEGIGGYGQLARISEGGVAAIEAKILAAVDRTNNAFLNSNINNTEYILVATIEDPDYISPGRVPNDMIEEVDGLENTSDGYLDAISDLRDFLGADHQLLIVNASENFGGYAAFIQRSFVADRNGLNAANLLFAHELGHNVGCLHAFGDTDVTYNTRKGWRLKTPNGRDKWRTIMAYNSPNDRSYRNIPYFSTLDVTFNGLNVGAPAGYDASQDDTVDPYLVAPEGVSGYDGTNPELGALNGPIIRDSPSGARRLANRETPTDTDGDGASDLTESLTGRNMNDASDLAFEFSNDLQSWFISGNSIESLSQENGNMFITVNGNDPNVTRNNFGFSGNSVELLEVRYDATSGNTFQIFWANEEGNFSAVRRISSVDPPEIKDGYAIAYFDLRNNINWAGKTISRLRIDPPGGAGSSTRIDYLRAISGLEYNTVDADNDGIEDRWEKENFGAIENHDDNTDTDQDGTSDRDEFLLGFNPNNSNEFLSLEFMEPSDGSGLSLCWPSKEGLTYSLISSSDLALAPSDWTAQEVTDNDGNTDADYVMPVTEPESRMFYRIRVLRSE